MNEDDTFESAEPEIEAPSGDAALVLDLDGYEGPLDVLLTLAREQKVDITKISILQLAEQYLAFIQQMRRFHLEVAADYLVMAAWLAYLKSRLLLPPPPGEEEPSGAAMAAALAFQLQRLDAMRKAGQQLMDRPQLGRDLFKRGAPEKFPVETTTIYDVSLYDLLSAYGRQRRRGKAETLRIADRYTLYAVEEALQLLVSRLGGLVEWQTLMSFLPEPDENPVSRRSAVAATFGAGLELAKSGKVLLRQDSSFGPIYVRAKQAAR